MPEDTQDKTATSVLSGKRTKTVEAVTTSTELVAAQAEPTVNVNQSIANMTVSELVSLIASVNQASTKSIVDGLAKALIEAKKPYVDPIQAENEKNMRASMRKQREQLEARLKLDQQNCPHMQGSNALSEEQGTRSSIIHHRLDDGNLVGLCSNCLHVFRPGDQDYLVMMRKKSGNKMSESGQRFFITIPTAKPTN